MGYAASKVAIFIRLPWEIPLLGSIRSCGQVDTFQKLVEEQTPGGLNEMVWCPRSGAPVWNR